MSSKSRCSKLFLLINLVLIVGVYSGCIGVSPTTPTTQFDLTIEKEGNGLVTPAVDTHQYNKDTTITLTAQPETGWDFSHWVGEVTDVNESETQVFMDKDKTVRAVFVKLEYELEINVEGEGHINQNIVVNTQGTEYQHGTKVELTAIPDQNWEFSHWEGDLTGSINPQTLLMDSEKSVKAVFEEIKHPLNITILGEGTVNKNVLKVDALSKEYKHGVTVELTAVPDQDWRFSHWEGDLKGDDNPISILMDEEKFITAVFSDTPFAGGAGTEVDPFFVRNPEQLDEVRNYLDKHFRQIEDINLVNYDSWAPIGEYWGDQFVGTYDGDNYIINNLVMGEPDDNDVGLFGTIGVGAKLKNIKLEDIEVTGSIIVGGLVGINSGGLVKNSCVKGDIIGDELVGLLIGYNEEGDILDCYAKGSITANRFVGGLIGLKDDGKLDNCFTDVSVLTGTSEIGGLVGYNSGDITNSYVLGNVTANETYGQSSIVGGLVGYNSSSSITNCYVAGDVAGCADVGGLVGYNNGGTITDCYALGNVSGSWYVGGLVSGNYGPGSIFNSYAEGNVMGSVYVGGLVGASDGEFIENSYATGNVTGQYCPSGILDLIGGLVGYHGSGEMKQCYAIGDVSGEMQIGGLVGYNGGSIAESYAIGNASGEEEVGGLAGYNGGEIINCYATGIVVGEDNLGGLVGLNRGEIVKTYSIGGVNVPLDAEHIGGLVGENMDTVSASYYNKETTLLDDINRGVPKTTEEMQQQDTFASWDFHSIWGIDEGFGYPYLRWQ